VALAPLGALWALVAGAAIWWFGLALDERAQFSREFRRGGAPVPAPDLP
jgi:hypothetical protein